MNYLFKFSFSMFVYLMLGLISNAQTTSEVSDVSLENCTPANCDPGKCNPKHCSELIKAGVCTPQQVAECLSGTSVSQDANHKMLTDDNGQSEGAIGINNSWEAINPAHSEKKSCCDAALCVIRQE